LFFFFTKLFRFITVLKYIFAVQHMKQLCRLKRMQMNTT
jgi:hypothetical protein